MAAASASSFHTYGDTIDSVDHAAEVAALAFSQHTAVEGALERQSEETRKVVSATVETLRLIEDGRTLNAVLLFVVALLSVLIGFLLWLRVGGTAAELVARRQRFTSYLNALISTNRSISCAILLTIPPQNPTPPPGG